MLRGRETQSPKLGICSLADSEVAGALGLHPSHKVHTWDVADLGTAGAEQEHWWGQAVIWHTKNWDVPAPSGNLVAPLCPGLSSLLCLPYLMYGLSLEEHWPYQLAEGCLLPPLLPPQLPQGPILSAYLLQQPVRIRGGSQMRAHTLLNPSTYFQKQNQCSKPLIPWGMEQEPLGDMKTCAAQLFSSSISLLLSQVCLQSTGPGAWCYAGTAERQALAFPITARTGKGQGTDVAPEKLSGTCTFTPCCNVQHRFSPYVQALDLARASVILHFRESLSCLKAPHTRHQLNNFRERSKKTVLFVCLFFPASSAPRCSAQPLAGWGMQPGLSRIMHPPSRPAAAPQSRSINERSPSRPCREMALQARRIIPRSTQGGRSCRSKSPFICISPSFP